MQVPDVQEADVRSGINGSVLRSFPVYWSLFPVYIVYFFSPEKQVSQQGACHQVWQALFIVPPC
ncbi:MAG: hypothetical protein MUF42_02960 [Cytophagaceae bacterium]|jgi:hypothetical protein|nr:hypothetical protein [Cytophagaceae bacterium]